MRTQNNILSSQKQRPDPQRSPGSQVLLINYSNGKKDMLKNIKVSKLRKALKNAF